MSSSGSDGGVSLKRKAPSKPQETRPTKKAKAAKKSSSRDDALNLEEGINTAFAHMDPNLLADYFGAQTKRFNDDLSLVELEERRLPASAIRDTTSFETEHTLTHLPDFLRAFSAPSRKAAALGEAGRRLTASAADDKEDADGGATGKKKTKAADKSGLDKGAPHTLVITGAGLRAATVTRALRVFQNKDSAVAKLFAKHIKLDEARAYVARTRMGIGVGTPRRITDLLDSGALSAGALERVVVDVSHVDVKKRGVLDMRELVPPLVDLLNRAELKERYGSGKGNVELLFY